MASGSLYHRDMGDVASLLGRLEELMAGVERLDDATAATVLELLEAFDALHRSALAHLGDRLGSDRVAELRRQEPSLAWLFDVYDVGVDAVEAAEAALAGIRGFIRSHGGSVEVLDARAGVVRVRLGGACCGCTGSAITLQHGVEQALRDHLPGFVALEVEQVDAPAHAPPGPTLLQIHRGG
jgi:Fe-S cluster biogenesis protein NfuA